MLRIAILGACAGLLSAAPAALAMGEHGLRSTPDRLTAGQPFTLTADLSGTQVSGQPSFRWDLDGDGTCETPWTADPSIAVTKAAGTYMFMSCARDAVGEMDCSTEFTVWPEGPAPAVTFSIGSLTWDEFLAHGATVQADWNRPITATYTARLGDQQLATQVIDESRLAVGRPQPPQDGRRHLLKIAADLHQDPIFGPIAGALSFQPVGQTISIPLHHPIGPLLVGAPERAHAATLWRNGLRFDVSGLSRKGGVSATLGSRRGRFLMGGGRANVDGVAEVNLRRFARAKGRLLPGTYTLQLKLHTAARGWIWQNRTIHLT